MKIIFHLEYLPGIFRSDVFRNISGYIQSVYIEGTSVLCTLIVRVLSKKIIRTHFSQRYHTKTSPTKRQSLFHQGKVRFRFQTEHLSIQIVHSSESHAGNPSKVHSQLLQPQHVQTVFSSLCSPEKDTVSRNSASYDSSPRSGPSRSASLRARSPERPKVTFSDIQTVGRQSSLPSASSESSLPESRLDWSDHLTIDGERVELRKKPLSSYDSGEG